MPTPRTVQLAASILECTTSIETFLAENRLASPSFAPGTPAKLPLPPSLQKSLDEALSAIDELNALLLGPVGWLVMQISHAYDLVSLHGLYRFNIPALIPVHGSVAVSELTARLPTVSPGAVARLLDHAVGNYVLDCPKQGHIAHSAISAMLSSSPDMQDWLGSACEDMWPAAAQVVPALIRWPRSEEPSHTGHNIAEGTQNGFFSTLGQDKERNRRFASAMSVMKNMPGFQPSAALEAYDWSKLGDATVVDVGGSKGDFALALTERYPHIRVVVQDVPDIVAEGRNIIQQEPGCAVTFQDHDFFKPQPVKDADAYFLRMILHDWPDEFCLDILRNLVPALKRGTRIIINDRCLPSLADVTHYEARQARCQDIAMMAMFNSKERSETEWRSLVKKADSRFHFESIVQIASSPMAVMEILWKPEDAMALDRNNLLDGSV